MDSITWADDVEQSLKKLGGKAHLSKIYVEVEKIRDDRAAPIGELKAWVRHVLQQNSREKGRNIFESVYPVKERKGIWKLK